MKGNKKISVFILSIVLISSAIANNIDSLYIVLAKERNAEALNKIAYAYYNIGKPDSTLILGLEAINVATKNNNYHELAIAYKNVGIGYMTKSDYTHALNYYKQSLSLFIDLKDNEQEARLYNNIATTYLIMGEFVSSLEYFEKALDKRNELGQEDSPLYGNLSIIYQQLGVHEKSLDFALKSIRVAEKENDLIGVAIGYGQLGEIYEHIGNYNQSEQYYLKSLEYLKDQGNNLRLARVYQNLGHIAILNFNTRKAKEYFNNSLNIKLQEGDKEGCIFSYIGLGEVEQTENNNNAAFSYYLMADQLAKEIKAKHLVTETSSKLGLNLFLRQLYNEANIKLNESNKLALDIGKIEILKNNYYYLSKIDSIQKNYLESLHYYQLYAITKDSILNEVKQKQIAEMQTRFDSEKKEKEIELLKRDSIIKDKEAYLHKQQKYVAFIGAFVFLVLLLMAGNRMKLRRNLYQQREAQLKAEAKLKEEELRITAEMNRLKAEKAQDELEHRNREITSSALFVAQKNEILSTIDEKLSELKTESKKEIIQLKKLIKDNIELDEDWNNFKMHFEQVHPRFFETLTTKYSDLTLNEQKICAYLRMNLSAKEIARLMNITPKSTQMSRYRLKKKFSLAADDDLLDFISKL